MSEFKGTPAPWKLGDEKYYNGNKAFEIHYGNDGECVSEVVHRVEDAKLISKSPILLQAIKDSINELREVGLTEMADYHEKLYLDCITL